MPKLTRHPDLGFAPETESSAIKMRLLRRHLAHAGTSPFYRELFAREGFDPRRVRTPADLAQLPCTTKRDLEERGQDGFRRGGGVLMAVGVEFGAVLRHGRRLNGGFTDCL